MKAIVYREYGPPDVLQLREVPKPVPKDNELLIKVHSSTVNRTDCGFLRAEPFIIRLFTGLFKPKIRTLGTEFAGEIEEIGKNITSFKLGDKVFGFNGVKLGAHAEYMIMAENGPLATMPGTISYNEAAPIAEGAFYALNNIRAAKIQSGQKILINGTTGAIGSAAVQLVKYFGAEVTAVCDTKNIELVRALGANEVIDYTKQDFTKINKTFDVVFDAVGKSSFGKCKPLLRKGGIYISTDLGYMAQNPFLAIITPIFGNKKVLMPIPKMRKEDVIFLKELVENGKYKPVIDRCYNLEQIAEAFKYVETGQKIGNVIITIDHKAKLIDN
jgi:NADPH:quinone reductase-like Zn-dependent oxidoreductase